MWKKGFHMKNENKGGKRKKLVYKNQEDIRKTGI